MDSQDKFAQRVTWGFTATWIVFGLIAGVVPLIGPLALGGVLFKMQTTPRPGTTRNPLPVWILWSAVGQYVSSYGLTQSHGFAVLQVGLFFFMCAFLWVCRKLYLKKSGQ